MNSGFWDDVGIETVAEINWIDVVTVKDHSQHRSITTARISTLNIAYRVAADLQDLTVAQKLEVKIRM